MPYSVEIKPSALASLKRLPKGIAARISDKIEVLSKEPRPQGVEKLAGEENLYRIRMGDYRVVYQIQDKSWQVLVLRIGHRKEV
jgi:mRNA interferase RelE/StbE